MSDLDPRQDPTDSAELRGLSQRLQRQRPVPSAAFRGELRRALLAEHRPRASLLRTHYRAVAAAYSCAGALALVIAALGVAGSGPFAA